MLSGARKWGVTLAGLILLCCGLAAMWTGWDQILIERGWSLFIGGATLVAGGAIVCAIGVLLARLDALNLRRDPLPAPIRDKASDKIGDTRVTEAIPVETRPTTAPKTNDESETPSVIDRYQSGEITYVMYSDGSVEVSTERGVQRYASVSDLRADMDP
jgi:hypothetical protein